MGSPSASSSEYLHAACLNCIHVVMDLTQELGHDAEEQENLKGVAYIHTHNGSAHAIVHCSEQARTTAKPLRVSAAVCTTT
jgi:hypothetical protein